MKSSQRAFDKIVGYEVTSAAVYKRKYQRPEWPGASSGATVGIGYDLGQTPAATIRADWGGRLPDAMVSAMASASGQTGAEKGKAATNRIHSQVSVPWETAIAVHKECVIPRWEARLIKSLPNSEKLPGDCFGALLSLIFNRGTSFNSSGARYTEMRAIKAAMQAENYEAIPGLIRSMKRLWPNLRGLLNRRDDEAALFEDGLKNWNRKAPPPPVASQERTPRPDPINMGDDDDEQVVPDVAKPLPKSKTIWGGVITWLTSMGSTIAGFFSYLDNPYTLTAFIVIVTVLCVGLYLIIKGRIDVNNVLKKLAQDE